MTLGTPLPLGRGVAGTLELWGPRLGPLMPSSKGGADEGTSCCENLGNRGILKCFLFIQVMAGGCFTGYTALPAFPSSALILYLRLLHKAELMKQTHFLWPPQKISIPFLFLSQRNSETPWRSGSPTLLIVSHLEGLLNQIPGPRLRFPVLGLGRGLRICISDGEPLF